ncbi:hypothetical protein IW262DRAFT_942210 [Armillaria fumosa]|nr:hypothetical protein IW262DRAFT_942210 [Armillaria fumosa]
MSLPSAARRDNEYTRGSAQILSLSRVAPQRPSITIYIICYGRLQTERNLPKIFAHRARTTCPLPRLPWESPSPTVGTPILICSIAFSLTTGHCRAPVPFFPPSDLLLGHRWNLLSRVSRTRQVGTNFEYITRNGAENYCFFIHLSHLLY